MGIAGCPVPRFKYATGGDRRMFDGYVTGRLRELLESDKCQFASESVTTQETALERQSRLRDRARQLREKREAERLAFVEEKYEQQFR